MTMASWVCFAFLLAVACPMVWGVYKRFKAHREAEKILEEAIANLRRKTSSHESR